MYAKVSKKGQVTIPKVIRERLDIKNKGAVLFIVDNNGEVKIKGVPQKPVEELAGSMNQYAKDYRPLKEIRKEIKGKIAQAASKEGSI